MDGGVAQVYRHRVFAVLVLHLFQALCNLVIGLFPGNLLPAVGGPFDGCAKPIRIVMNILQSDCLWADMPLADGVLFVPPYGRNFSALQPDFKTADRFTQVAGDVVCLVRVFHLSKFTRF